MSKRLIALLLTLMLALGATMVPAIAEDDIDIEEPTTTEQPVATPTPEPEKPEETKAPTEAGASLEIGFLTALGVLSDSFDATVNVTKGQFAAMVANVLYPDLDFFKMEVPADAPNLYNDVTATHEYYSEIKACKDLKIINGDDAGNFNPDENITLVTGVTILINALGYKPYADINGGFPTGYFVVAAETGMTKDISMNRNDPLAGSVAAKLIYNSLFADAVRITSIGNGETNIEINKGKNVLSEQLGIKEYDAVVSDNGILSMNGESIVGEEQVILKDVKTSTQYIVYEANSMASSYFGQRVKAFVKYNSENSRDEIVFLSVHPKNKVTSINSDRIIKVANGQVEYELEKDADKTLKLNIGAKLPLVYINGSLTADYVDADLKPVEGFVNFIDNDNDNKIDIIEVNDFTYFSGVKKDFARNIVVDRINAEDGIVNCKFNPVCSLDMEDDSLYDYRVFKDGKLAALDDVSVGNIVSVAESPKTVKGKTLYTLYVSEQTATGAVSSKSDASKEVTLADGTVLEFSSSLTSVKKNVIADMAYEKEITFSLDILGKVAYVDDLAKDTPNYAYIIGVQKDSDFGNDTVKVKLYAQPGQFVEYEMAPKAKIDGATFESYAKAVELLNKRPDGSKGTPKTGNDVIARPVIIRLDSDKRIKEIDTDAPNSNDEANKLLAGKRFPKITTYFPAIKTFDGSFYLNENTVVLKVADVDRYNLANDISNMGQSLTYKEAYIDDHEQDPNNANNYGIWSPSQLLQTMSYDAQAYDVDPDTGIAGLVVVRGMVAYNYQDQKYNLPYNVFKRLTKTIDEETGKEIYKMYYFNAGSEKSVVVDPDTLNVWYNAIIFGEKVIDGKEVKTKFTNDDMPEFKNPTIQGLKEGDIFRFEAQGGKISHIERIINISDIGNVCTGSLLPTAPNAPYTSSSVGINNVHNPFDGRWYKNLTLDQTYTSFLGTAIKIKNGMLELRTPYSVNSSTMSTHNNYLNNNKTDYVDRLYTVKSAKTILVEEIECDKANDNCKYRIRTGDMADIITTSDYPADDATTAYNKASKVYLFGLKGVYSDCIIFNLKPEHNAVPKTEK